MTDSEPPVRHPRPLPPLGHADFLRLCTDPERDEMRWISHPERFVDPDELADILQACRSGGFSVLGLNQRGLKERDFDAFSACMKRAGVSRLTEFDLRLQDAPFRQNLKGNRRFLGAEFKLDASRGPSVMTGFFPHCPNPVQGGAKVQFSDGTNFRDIGTLSPWTLWREVRGR